MKIRHHWHLLLNFSTREKTRQAKWDGQLCQTQVISNTNTQPRMEISNVFLQMFSLTVKYQRFLVKAQSGQIDS